MSETGVGPVMLFVPRRDRTGDRFMFKSAAWATMLIAFFCAALRADGDGGFCLTQQRWAMDNPPLESGECPLHGDCDLPEVRDAAIPDGSTIFRYLRMRIVVFAEDDGSNSAATQELVDEQVARLNDHLIPSRLAFIVETDFVNSTEFRHLEQGEDFFMKEAYAESPASQVNVFVVDNGHFSFGTFPWGPDALTFEGGIVMDDGHFATGRSILTHEVGHNLGLWHTHHGVSEVPACSPCYETADGEDGDITGDYASDTPPTPLNLSCQPPQGVDSCSGFPWGETDFTNYMGLASDTCSNHFTSQQLGRQQCWLDALLSGWVVPPISDGDYDRDGDLDLLDYDAFAACVTGPGGVYEDDCQPGDFDTDGDIDLLDFKEFSRRFTGDCGTLINVHPVSVTTCLGDSAFFWMSASGSDLDYLWTLNGEEIFGEVAPTLLIEPVTSQALGQYAGHAISECAVAHTADATLAAAPNPIITSAPPDVTTCLGEPADFAIVAAGFGTLTYQWQHDAVDIPGAVEPAYHIDAVTVEDLGDYTCEVTDSCDALVTTFGNPARLGLIPPVIETHPIQTLTCEGLSASFSVEATGDDPITYQWRLDGSDIPGAVDAIYTIDPVTDNDLGSYSCLVGDACGGEVESSSGPLQYSHVFITTQPVGGAFCEGDTIFLFVGIAGGFEFQWFKDDQALPGETNPFLVIQDAATDDSGAYHLYSASLCDEVVSDDAVVEVTPCGGP